MGSADAFRLLTRGDVRTCLAAVDPLLVVEDALRQHARGETTLPAEAYLPWTNSQSAYCRSLAMPGMLGTGADSVIGLKVINAAVSNPLSGLARAAGFTALFDHETGRTRLVAEGALVSALRTAAYTMVSLRHLGPTDFSTVAMIGCGNLAVVHAELLARYFPGVRELRLFDVRRPAAEALAESWSAVADRVASVHGGVEETLAGAEVVVTLTTSADPYIEPSWLHPRAFVAHVSLDDLRREVFTDASAIFVDDVALVAENPRRILGALMNEGLIAPAPSDTGGPHLAGTLGDVLCGTVEAVRPVTGRVVSNPFGMSILDLALMGEVDREARRTGAGVVVDLTTDN